MKFSEWKQEISASRWEITLSLVLLAIAIFFNRAAGVYADKKATAVSPDILLDILPVVNLNVLYVWLYLFVIVVLILYPLIFAPRKLYYVLTMLSIFVSIRSGFLILTHLKAPPEAVGAVFPSFLSDFDFSNDLFFSGHVGLSFLGFLVFKNKYIKAFMLTSSIILAITVLFMHQHYSIDVASAYFITYGIYKFGSSFLK